MKTAVIYRSMTGHSKKIARAIGAELGVEAQKVKKKKPQLAGVDLAFLVGGIYSGKSLPQMLDFANTLTPAMVARVALVTSSAMDKVGQDQVRAILTANQIPVIDEYRCRGNFLLYKMGHPNKKEIAGAVAFARGLVN